MRSVVDTLAIARYVDDVLGSGNERHEKKMEEIAEQRYVLYAPSIHIEQRRLYFFGVG